MKYYNKSNFSQKTSPKKKSVKIISPIYFTNRKKSEQYQIMKNNTFLRMFPDINIDNIDNKLSHFFKSGSDLEKIINKEEKYNDLFKSTEYYFKNKLRKQNLKKNEIHISKTNMKNIFQPKPKKRTKKLSFIPTIQIDLGTYIKNKNNIKSSKNSKDKNKKLSENLLNDLSYKEKAIKNKIYLNNLNSYSTNISRKPSIINSKYHHKKINTSYIFNNKTKIETNTNTTKKQVSPLKSNKNTENKKIKEKIAKETKSLLDNIKSKYIFKRIISNVLTKKIYSLFKYNKKEQKKLNINMNDYDDLCKTEIELISRNSYGKFINYANEKDEQYYHIYFNSDEKEINRNYFYENESVKNIKIIIDYHVKSFKELFHNCVCIESIKFKKFNGNNITDMSYMFYNCTSLIKLDLSNFDTSNVIKMDNMFRQCTSLKEVDLSKFNTKKVNTLSKMFFQCTSLKKINLANFRTDKLRYMTYMFYQCSSLEELNISNFDTSKIKDMSYLFCECSSLKKLNISNFDTNNVINMSYMFSGCSSLRTLNLSNFKTTNVTNMNNMFQGCSSLKEINLSIFNTKKVIDMSNMFHGCSLLKEVNLSNFITDNVSSINKMFYGCLSLKNLNFINLNTKNIIDMSSMFVGCPYKLIQEIKSRFQNIGDEAFE